MVIADQVAIAPCTDPAQADVRLLRQSRGRPSLFIQGDTLLATYHEFDLIEAITGHPNLTHAWNRFRLKAEVEKVLHP